MLMLRFILAKPPNKELPIRYIIFFSWKEMLLELSDASSSQNTVIKGTQTCHNYMFRYPSVTRLNSLKSASCSE